MSLLDYELLKTYKSMIGLTNVDNTSDLNKPISIATQTALNSKLNLVGGTLTGGLTGTTASFSGPLVANGATLVGGLTGTTASFSGPMVANGATLTSGLTGTTASFSEPLVANGATLVGGLTGTTASFSGPLAANGATLIGGLTGTSASFSGPLAANGGLTGTTASFSADLTVLGRIFCVLPEYIDNTAAKNAGIPIGALYRTGGIIKIRLDDISPVLTLSGNANIVVKSLTYTDPGVTATDNYDSSVSVYLTSFLFNSTNIISSPVLINGTNTVVTTTTPLQFGNIYTLTYTATDTTGNVTTINRNVSIVDPTVTTTYLYTSTNIRATSDRAPLPRYANNNLYLENYSAWAPLTSSLNNIDFNIDNQWTFIFKVLQSDEQPYTIHLDPLFRSSTFVWGTNTTYGFIGETDDTLGGNFYARLNDLVARNPTYTVTNIQSGLTSEFITNSPSGYMVYIKYDSSKYLTTEMWSGNGATRYFTAKRKQPYTFVNKLAPFAFYSNVQSNDLITYQKGILFSNALTDVPITTWNTYFP
jgi:hypothetical protein